MNTQQLEREYWLLDHRINQRGLPLDRDLINSAIKVDRLHKAELKRQLQDITGLDNPGSNPAFLDWLHRMDLWVPNVTKDTVAGIVKDPLWHGTDVQDACKLKLEYSKTSNAKWKSARDAVSEDGRLRNVFQFAGAQRTKRWAGRIFQPHNLPSSMYDDSEVYNAAVESIFTENPHMIEAIWGSVPTLLSQSIRGMVKAEPGNKLVVCDYSAIESRVLGWLADCPRILNIFREDRDTYKDFASALFNVPYEAVTKQQRKFVKPVVLGAGYGLGRKGLQQYAEGFGIHMSDADADQALATDKRLNPEVVTMRKNYKTAIRSALENPDQWYAANKVLIGQYKDMLLIRLPSGAHLHYYKPRWEKVKAPWTDDDGGDVWIDGFTYMGVNQYTTKWERICAHPGKTTENIDQAIARGILADGLLRADGELCHPIGHVHDEIICEVEERNAENTLDVLNEIMSTPPDWCSDLPLSAAGWIGNRYRKD